METIYIEGNDTDFVLFIQNLGGKAEFTSIDGHARWIITKDDGTKYIARPKSAKKE